MHRAVLNCFALSGLLLLPIGGALAQVSVYHDRPSFLAALASPPSNEDYESYALGEIALGDVRGDFRYTFDPSITQPATVPDGAGGQALGGSPFDVFVGDDSVTLTTGAGSFLKALGADFLYAPSFDTIPADTYRIGIVDGAAAGRFVGNLDSIDPDGGSFFLGLIATPGCQFASANLFSVQLDPNFVVPAYQVDNLVYASAVPEPGELTLFAAGLCVGLVGMRSLRRRRRCLSPAANSF